MLISADVTGLEVVTAGFLSKDATLCQEIRDHVDIHAVNQHDVLGLPPSIENRKVAKRFKFKMIYGGTPGGFASDPDFGFLRWNKARWEKIKDAYYEKYAGIREWHKKLVDQVMHDGCYIGPTGRYYDYREILKNPEWYYVPKIKNYPVQGLGAEVVLVARVSLANRWKPDYGLLINTIHDSIIIDTPAKQCYNIIELVNNVFADLPENLNRTYKLGWDLPLEAKVKHLDGREIE